MASIVIAGDTSGTVTLSAPAVAGTVVLTLPTASGTLATGVTNSGTPFLTALGSGAGSNITGTNSTAVGYRALYTSTTGVQNTAVGANALNLVLTGGYNTAVGSAALYKTTGDYNTGVGVGAGEENLGGTGNSFYGAYSGNKTTTGNYNTAAGYYSLNLNTTADSNTGFGAQALNVNTTGTLNVAIGRSALNGNTTGSNNVAIGSQALFSNTTASNNTAVGFQAAKALTTGNNCVAIGTNALVLATLPVGAVAIGSGAFSSFIRTGDSSNPGVAIGYNAGSSVTTAYGGSICIGDSSGTNFTTGFGCIYVGQNSTASSGAVTDEIVLCTRVTTGKGTQTFFVSPNGGASYQGNNSASWSVTSDQRLKKNIVDNDVGLEAINAVRVRNFEYRLPEEVDPELKPTDAIVRTGVQLGVIAQEIQAVLPDCVKQESTGVLSVDSDNLTWYLINAVKELTARIALLEAK